jgi:hypothetical protein
MLVILCAWSPWLTAEEAHEIINQKIILLEKSYPDLCPIKIRDNTIHKVLFGYREKIYYDCSEINDIFGVEKAENVVFVTFYKETIGLPKKFVRQ